MKAKDAYTESFGDRGSKYDQAMRQVPESRREEFMAVIEELSDADQGVLLDIPAGGGYLEKYLPARFIYQPYEPVQSFLGAEEGGDSPCGILPIPLASGSVDIVVSVAGVHHFEDKLPLFEDMYRVAVPGARLLLADVHRRSPVAGFLDGYIDANNSTGHRGYYLGEDTLAALSACGWQVESAARKHYHWVFDSPQQMTRYCHLLFDIGHDDYAATGKQIERELGVTRLPGGQVGMGWDLFVVNATKRMTS